MSRTFTTGQTLIDDAADTTNWNATRFSGSGQAPSAAQDTTVFREGSASVAAKLAGNNWNAALIFDWYAENGNATIDLTASGSEIISMWVLMTTPSVALTEASDGMYIGLSSSNDTGNTNPTVYSEWTVGGSDNGTEGWKLYLLDTRKTPTQTVGGGCDLSAVRRIFFGVRNISSVGNVKADNTYLDFLNYKTPIYKVVGTSATPDTITWNDFLQDSITNENGLIQDAGGFLQLSCGIQIGDDTQTEITQFIDATGTNIVFKRYTYENGTSVVDALNFEDIYTITAQGNTSPDLTQFTLGSSVGSGDDRQGILGGQILGETTDVHWGMDMQTDISQLSKVQIYGASIKDAQDGILLDGKSTTSNSSIIGCTFNLCGEIDLGASSNGAEFLNNTVINPSSFTDSDNPGLLFSQTPAAGTMSHNAKNLIFICSDTPATQHATRLDDASTYSITFNNFKFFGNYTSGTNNSTHWHGENSGNNSVVTVSATNGTNAITAEFNETGTGSPSTTVVSAVDVDITVKDEAGNNLQGVQVYIEDSSQAVVMNEFTDSSGFATTSYTGTTPESIIIYARKSSPLKNVSVAQESDGGVFTDRTTEANNDTANDFGQTAMISQNDALYVGYTNKFGELTINLGTAESGAGTYIWEYWNGSAWTTLSTNFQDDTSALTTTGTNLISFSSPTDWEKNDPDSGGTALGEFYYVRARLDAATTTAARITRVYIGRLNSTRYFPVSTSGTISTTGFDLLITLQEDSIANTNN